MYGKSPSSFAPLSRITLPWVDETKLVLDSPLLSLYGNLLWAKLLVLGDRETALFLLFGVAGAATNSGNLVIGVEPVVPPLLE